MLNNHWRLAQCTYNIIILFWARVELLKFSYRYSSYPLFIGIIATYINYINIVIIVIIIINVSNKFLYLPHATVVRINAPRALPTCGTSYSRRPSCDNKVYNVEYYIILYIMPTKIVCGVRQKSCTTPV